MTNIKCTIDCAKYNVKWNIEFWGKWNAIGVGVTVSEGVVGEGGYSLLTNTVLLQVSGWLFLKRSLS